MKRMLQCSVVFHKATTLPVYLLAASVVLITSTFCQPKPISSAEGSSKPLPQLAKVQTNDLYAPFLINNVFNYYGNNGDGSFNPYSQDNEGFEWPKGGGTGKSAVFEDGLAWACYHNGTLKANGSSYYHGLQAGKILPSGSADDPYLSKYRIYRVRPDIGPATTWDAAMQEKIKTQEGDLIRNYQSTVSDNALYLQYLKDWNEWPAFDGAPYTDVNGNGVYDPSIDIPGVPGADQTLWHVSNDQDPTRTEIFAGSAPIGIEVQRTVWGYNRPGVLGNTIFLRYRLVNKSSARLDSMYVGQWTDPDIGGSSAIYTDVVGCDTTLDLAYAYKSQEINQGYGFPPPALGTVLVQGPLVPSSAADSAVTYTGWRRGYRNLRMTAYSIFLGGNATYIDPHQGIYNATLDWYNILHGLNTRTGLPFVDPLTGKPTSFVASGDPVTGAGWVGEGLGAADKRFVQSSGPFTMAIGDTQDVVIAATIAVGVDRLSSVTALKSAADQLKSGFRGTPQVVFPPSMTATPTVVQGQSTQLSLSTDCRGLNVKSIDALLRLSNGSLVATVPLFDDGAHGDGPAGDGVFAATTSLPQQSSALSVDANVSYLNSTTGSWRGLVNSVVTAGPVLVTSPVIVSDNLNSDGVANPGEDVRFGFTLVNNSTVPLQNVSVELISASKMAFIGNVGALSSTTLGYDATNAATYLNFTAPKVLIDSTVLFSLLIKDPSGNRWPSSTALPVKLMKYPMVNQVVTRMSGPDGGNFAISIVDPTKVKDHLYYIYGIDSVNAAKARGYRLVDKTTGAVLIDNHPLPDVLGHTSPVVDGFKVIRGTIDTVEGRFTRVSVTRYAGTAVTPAVDILLKPWSDSSWSFDVAGSGSPSAALFALNWKNNTSDDYEIRITPNDNTASEYYLGADGGGLNRNTKAFTRVPMQIWDVTQNRRLIVKVVQNRTADVAYDTVGGGAVTYLGARVGWDQVFATTAFPYAEPLPAISPVEEAGITSVLGKMIFVDWRAQRYFPPAGTVIRISSRHLVSSADSWSFNPAQILSTSPMLVVPTSFSLSQNYPNPFNPSTTIRFEIVQRSAVKLKIFNVLGQLLTTLVDEQRNGGAYSVEWNATEVASGVYFYQLQAGEFVQTKKMILMK